MNEQEQGQREDQLTVGIAQIAPVDPSQADAHL
jgi:hypothetical protein